MLALCLFFAQHHADFCIPDFQRLAFEMCWFENGDLQLSPFDIGLKHPFIKFKFLTVLPPNSIRTPIAL
jgi:hypothetical protein